MKRCDFLNAAWHRGVLSASNRAAACSSVGDVQSASARDTPSRRARLAPLPAKGLSLRVGQLCYAMDGWAPLLQIEVFRLD